MGHAEEALSMLTLWDELGDDFPCEFGALWGEMNEHRTRDIARQGLKFPSHHARLDLFAEVHGAYGTSSCAKS